MLLSLTEREYYITSTGVYFECLIISVHNCSIRVLYNKLSGLIINCRRVYLYDLIRLASTFPNCLFTKYYIAK